MALLKKRQSADLSHSRKSSTNSICSNSNSVGSKYNNSSAKPNLSTHTEIVAGSNNHQANVSPMSSINSTNQDPISRNGSRLSSAPISGNSTNKRFSLSLRSFSSNSSLNNNSKEELNHKNGGKNVNKNEFSSTLSPKDINESKLIFDWDVTDPKAWSWQRVVMWLQLNDFSSKWISFFKRSQIAGNDFLKLMAHENFAKIEKYLPTTQTSSYSRFQYLLKRTMEHNVIYQQHSHSRSLSSLDSSYSKKSGYSKHFRTGSDQVSIGSNLKNVSNDKLIEMSEGEESYENGKSAAADVSSATIKVSEENKTPGSGKSLAVLVPESGEKSIVPKLNLPVPPKDRKSKVKTESKIDTFSSLYRRSFISIKGGSSEENSSQNNQETSKTADSTAASRSNSLSRKNSPIHSPSNSHYTFFKKHHHKGSDISSNLAPADPPSLPVSKKAEIDPKYLPKTKLQATDGTENGAKEVYVFCSKDRQNFIPINVTYATDVSTFKAALATHNNINHKNYSIFLIDYEFEIGTAPLTDEVIKEIMDCNYRDNFNMFFIKNHLKIQLNRNRSNSSMVSQHRKLSLKSNVSKVSLGSSDLDDCDNISRYSKTPAHILETINPADYLSAAGKPRTRRSTVNSALSVQNSNNENASSFKVIRPDTTNKIDFNNKRDTPFVKLNPSRDPPPPPPSPSMAGNIIPIPLPDSGSQKKETRTLHRPPPPNMILNDTDKASAVPKLPPRPSFSRKPSSTSLKHRSSNTSLVKLDNMHTRLSRSNSSIQSSIFISPPRLLKRQSSRRIVSSALAGGDTFDENKISFDDVPSFSDNTDSNSSSNEADDNKTKAALVPDSMQRFDETLKAGNNETLKAGNDETVKTGNDETVKAGNDAFLFADAGHVSEEDEEASSDDSGIAWIDQDHKEQKPSSNVKNATPKAKKSLLEGEISSDCQSSFKNTDAANSNSDAASSSSDDGIVWTVNPASAEFQSKALQSDDRSAMFSFLKNEEDDENGLLTENRDVEEDKTGFSFDSDSILGSLVNEINETSKAETSNLLKRKMTLRPSADLVYKNLEVYFPGTDLDKPIVEGSTPPGSPRNFSDSKFSKSNTSDSSSVAGSRSRTITEASAIKHSSEKDDYTFSSTNSTPYSSTNSSNKRNPPKRTKTLRILASEALEIRNKKIKNKYNSSVRRNDTTKLWGTKVIEITDKEKVVAINKNRNSKGQYSEFAWIKGEVIGKGSFGCVYLGMNLTTGEMIAVKQVESSTDSQIEALRSEMETLKDLDHLNIVQYLGFEVKNNVYSLFLEYVAGGSVGALIRMFGRFDDVLIRFLNHQVLLGLSYLHNRGILHRDMKADNLLLDLDGVCKISDFGISKKSNDIYSNSEMTMTGTIFWMAPEMVDTKQGYSAKVDIWSLGCIVLEMFAGKRPWSNLEVVAAMFKIGKYKSAPPIPKDTLPLISAEGIEFLDLCFQIDPEKRPTAAYLLENKVFEAPSNFKFAETDLAKFTTQNHKTMSLPEEFS